MLSVFNDNELRSKFDQIQDADELAVQLAIGYRNWKRTRRENTSDEVFAMVLNFIEVMHLYRIFRISLRAGDAIMIEWLYIKFLPIFATAGKFIK